MGMLSWLVRRNARNDTSVVEVRFAMRKNEGTAGFGDKSPIPIP